MASLDKEEGLWQNGHPVIKPKLYHWLRTGKNSRRTCYSIKQALEWGWKGHQTNLCDDFFIGKHALDPHLFSLVSACWVDIIHSRDSSSAVEPFSAIHVHKHMIHVHTCDKHIKGTMCPQLSIHLYICTNWLRAWHSISIPVLHRRNYGYVAMVGCAREPSGCQLASIQHCHLIITDQDVFV